MTLPLEWLECDGAGGFACGTVSGELTRKWHGLLWAARRPPRERSRFLAGIQEVLVDPDDRSVRALTPQWRDGKWQPAALTPEFERLPFPRWSWRIGPDEHIHRTLWMAHGHAGTLFVRYEYEGTGEPPPLVLRCILPREHQELYLSTPPHREVRRSLEEFEQQLRDGILPEEIKAVRFLPGEVPEAFERVEDLDEETRSLIADMLKEFNAVDIEDQIHPRKLVRNVDLAIEHDCEDVHTEDLQLGQQITIRLRAGSPVDLVFSPLRPSPWIEPGEVMEAERARREALNPPALPPEHARLGPLLALAADQFIARTFEGHTTILAGYPWFTDWGRDAMISIPGLCLATGRRDEAREIIRHFIDYLRQGLIPNLFPEQGEEPKYNTVDATLWLVEMAARCWTIDEIVADESLWNALNEVIAWHRKGTLNDIRLDADGLLRAGAPGTQLTWMDVKVNGEVPTPRHGKPVEIQGLWYNALLIVAEGWRSVRVMDRADELEKLAAATAQAFAQRFFATPLDWPADVVDRDAPGDADTALRPNAVLPFALRHNILPSERRVPLLRAVTDRLLTPRGLRTLDPGHTAYKGIYRGNVLTRDRAYHQGTAWMWLLWPYACGLRAEAHRFPEAQAQLALLRTAMAEHLQRECCIGQANEIFDGNSPHQPRGCFGQAWSVAAAIEVLGLA